MSNSNYEGIEKIFQPKSVAVVGASRKEGKLGNIILRNMLDAGFKGDLYPINPKTDEILGLKCYSSLNDLPHPVDLAVIIIPSKFVVDALRGSVGKYRSLVVISGGFRESGEEGAKLERELVKLVKKENIRMVGPNCQGVANPSIGLCATWPLITSKGGVSVVSQSGTVAAYMAMKCEEERIGISKLVALGNKADIDEIDMLDYLRHDGETKVVAMYIEGTKDGKKFLESLRECCRVKPVVILKSGRTKAGVKAVQSHTGSLAGSDKIYDAAIKQAGALRVDTLEDLYDSVKALSTLPKPGGGGVLVVTSSGGSGILAVDLLDAYGIPIYELPDDKKIKLIERLPSQCIVRNPLDLTGSATVDMYRTVLDETIDDKNLGGYLLIFGDMIPGASELVSEYKNHGKPIVVSYLGGGSVEKLEKKQMNEAGIPVFETPERAVKALISLYHFS